MVVTFEGMTKSPVSPSQPEKVEYPMEVTLSGMVSFPEKFLQPLKAE
jgi:hypothetical protein